ncbi:hypothetical protein JVT61DRAFT_1781 [Boletus reticuloceps]|uniref:Uncharacterized protein n=1 Tax=Boletus reticuloceps TaxID=495285 RepID=A0A8I2YPV4_9AGAM|nr:hypothetical protein JVT61DRAFT_1781 [Boletus reticuloceps]
MSSSPPSTKKEEFNQLPRAFKQLQFQAVSLPLSCLLLPEYGSMAVLQSTKVLRTATALKELPSVLILSNDRRVPFPPLVHYGYALHIERMDELLEQKLGAEPGILDANPFGVLVHLQHEVFNYRVNFQTVYLDGTDSMFFLSVRSNWEPAPEADRLEKVVKRLKDFLDVDEEPVWCLDARKSLWKKGSLM